MSKKNLNPRTVIETVSLLLLGAAVTLINAVSGTSAVPAVLTYMAGSAFYVLYAVTSYIDESRYYDHLQSGKLAALTMAALIISAFRSDSTLLVMSLVLPAAFAAEAFLHLMLRAEKRELFIYGFFFNLILVTAVLCYRKMGSIMDMEWLRAAIYGIVPSALPGYPVTVAALCAGLAGTAMVTLFLPEIACLSQGKVFFQHFEKWRCIVLAIRAAALSAVFLFQGWLGGFALFRQNPRCPNSALSVYRTLLFSLTVTQSLLLLTRWTGPIQTAFAVIALSAGFSLLRRTKPGGPYG